MAGSERRALMREYPTGPVLGVGVVVLDGPRVLLIQRANDPGRGQWSVPGGVVELGETMHEAGQREVGEECGVEVEVGSLVETYDLIQRDEVGEIRFHYVLMHFAARYLGGSPAASSDALDVGWYTKTDLAKLDMPDRLREVIVRAMEEGRG
jgi:8-oxo-dGTP diphosphatase